MTVSPQGANAGFAYAVSAVVPQDWESLLTATEAVDYAQTQHWQDVMCRHRKGAEPVWLTVRHEDKLIAGLAAVVTPQARRVGGVLNLHRIDSSVDGVSCGPLVHPALPVAEQELVFQTLITMFLEQRPSGFAAAGMALSESCDQRFGHLLPVKQGWTRRPSPTAVLSLAGGPEVVASQSLVVNKRNERNRGLRRGAEVFATNDANLLAQYYPIYEQASAHWGVDPLALALLQDLLADPDGRVFFTCVRLAGQVIGGHLCLHLGDVVFAWNGVTHPDFARSHFPATLCFWGDIVAACERGARWLDFGASGGVNSLAGFKKYFGAQLQERGFYEHDSARMATLRRVRQMMVRVQSESNSRWHDGATGQPGRGHGQ